MDEVINFYFTLGFRQMEILSCLYLIHNEIISKRTLQRKLKAMGLYRRKNVSDVITIATFIKRNLETYGQLHGYRWMHLKCLQNGLVVTQQMVRILLQTLDPEGVEIRTRRRLRRRQYRNKGPNFLWHMDCYDKLKPFGICISGCIDGFSRNIIWLRAGNNSNDPRVIASYYIDVVLSIEGCPKTVRADLGTENGVVEQLQLYLRENKWHSEPLCSLPPFLYGTSPANQRIEAWWAILRKQYSQFWINLFHELKDNGQFSGSYLDKSLIQFCFLRLIQKELDIVATEWNMHRISSSRNSVSPRGRPFVMYHMPEIYQSRDYLCKVSIEHINLCREFCAVIDEKPCDSDVYELSAILMAENQLALPENPYDAVDLYIILRDMLLNVL
ncbi:hypothetical protein PPYR_04655 [Photinus pyralis]|uniref:Integrase core domain-containing protein n=1 Tax=Photinus pyralis TaxID=7054 RepID=A0A5N4AEV0_PHOPY|nr:uncharacterized protein LOC116164762 [Photinus pyralis]XP_031348543.1 uncharacterized protein LOC116174713 [Photinus pyralis]KAB0795826.1 hypothetical protein PPYR_09887 [Photinus pyralis]KAB0802469.1 hypothetical protein PPYR_04655 [Photinus pyralis]